MDYACLRIAVEDGEVVGSAGLVLRSLSVARRPRGIAMVGSGDHRQRRKIELSVGGQAEYAALLCKLSVVEVESGAACLRRHDTTRRLGGAM
jgi:hypothetical protein